MTEGDIVEVAVTIPNGGQNSGIVWLDRAAIVRIRTPDAFDGTALTFQEGTNADSMLNLVKDGAIVSVSATPSTSTIVPPADFCGFTAFRVVSNAIESASRTLTLVTRRV